MNAIAPSDSPSKNRSRGRPMQLDREKIVAIALEKFWQHGYTDTSINQIADAANTTRASLYNCFGDKESLFLEVLQHYTNHAPDAILSTITPTTSIRDSLITMLKDACARRASDTHRYGCLAVNCINELLGSDSHLHHTILSKVHTKQEQLEHILTQAILLKELPQNTNITVKANSLLSFIFGLSTFSKTGASEEDMWLLCQDFLTSLGFTLPQSTLNSLKS